MWSDIHIAALDLAIQGGLAAATIDRIAEKASISRRTFFNYFPTKEDAILGIHEPTISNDAWQEFHNSTEDNLSRTVLLLARVFQAARPLSASKMSRIEVVEQLPGLLAHFSRSGDAVAKIVEPVIRPFLATRASDGAPASDGTDEAQMLVAAAKAIIVSAYLKVPAFSYSDPAKSLAAAITTFRKAIS